MKEKSKNSKPTRARECAENAKITTTTVALADFVENPDNPSVASDEDIARLAGKLKRVPLGLTAMRIAYVTDAIEGKRMVISGNKRLRVLKQAYGEDGEVPAEWFADVTAMSEAERHEFIVTANVSDGEWDVDKLLAQYDKSELGDLMPSEDLEKLLDGIEEAEAEGETDADAVPEVPEEPKSKRGAVYQLGRHRVMCGDSTKADDVEKLMGGKCADMAFTSPPYNVGKNERLSGNTHMTDSKYKNIDDDDADYQSLLTNFTKLSISHAKYSFVNIQMLAGNKMNVIAYLNDFKDSFCDVSIWDKQHSTPAMAERVMNTCFEFVFIFSNESHSRVVGTRDFRGDVSNVYRGNPQRNNEFAEIHAATFPVELPLHFIETFSNDNEGVLDLFCGTGTTIIAAEKKNRVGFGMELSPQYVDVIRRRWAEFVHGEGCDWEKLTPEVVD